MFIITEVGPNYCSEGICLFSEVLVQQKPRIYRVNLSSCRPECRKSKQRLDSAVEPGRHNECSSVEGGNGLPGLGPRLVEFPELGLKAPGLGQMKVPGLGQPGLGVEVGGGTGSVWGWYYEDEMDFRRRTREQYQDRYWDLAVTCTFHFLRITVCWRSAACFSSTV